MKLTVLQWKRLLNMSGYLDGILEQECRKSGKSKEEYEDDAVYNGILQAIGGLEEAIENAEDNLEFISKQQDYE